jgi:hypothetical protein
MNISSTTVLLVARCAEKIIEWSREYQQQQGKVRVR